MPKFKEGERVVIVNDDAVGAAEKGVVWHNFERSKKHYCIVQLYKTCFLAPGPWGQEVKPNICVSQLVCHEDNVRRESDWQTAEQLRREGRIR